MPTLSPLSYQNSKATKHIKNFLVTMRIGETPVPIPNTTVKTYTADGTAKVGE